MNDFLVKHSFLKGRKPTVSKVRRDGIMMYCEARYVIVLDQDGNIIEKINRSKSFNGNYLVVLAPVVYKDCTIDLSVVLEIGLSRSVPYNQFERCLDTETRFTVKARYPIAKLSDEKIISLLPLLGETLQKVVDEDVSHYRNLIYFTSMKPSGGMAKMGKELALGKFITISEDESILAYVCLAIDMETRASGHLSLFVELTRAKLRTLKYAYYPGKAIKRFKCVEELAQILIEADYPIHFVEIIRTKLGKETGKIRSLFEQVVEVFQIKFKETTHKNTLLYFSLHSTLGSMEENLKEKFKISIMDHPKRDCKKKENRKFGSSMHAKGCVRVEVYPSKEAIDKINPKDENGERFINLSTSFTQ